VIVLVLCLLAAPPASGAKKAAAQLIDEGNELLDQRQYQAALARYEAAHALYPTPKIFFNMAEAHRELKNYVEAIEHYERFLAESGVKKRSPLRKQAAREIADLERRIGRLRVEGGTLGAEVFVDGKLAGKVPLLGFRLLPGFHQVAIQIEGAIAKRIEVEVKRGEEAAVDASVEIAPPPPPPAAPPPPPPPIAVAPPVTAPVAPEEEGSIASEWWFWTLIGGAVAIGVGAAVVATTLPKDDFVLGGDLGVSSTDDWRSF
jgi:hypothetical protein